MLGFGQVKIIYKQMCVCARGACDVTDHVMPGNTKSLLYACVRYSVVAMSLLICVSSVLSVYYSLLVDTRWPTKVHRGGMLCIFAYFSSRM